MKITRRYLHNPDNTDRHNLTYDNQRKTNQKKNKGQNEEGEKHKERYRLTREEENVHSFPILLTYMYKT